MLAEQRLYADTRRVVVDYMRLFVPVGWLVQLGRRTLELCVDPNLPADVRNRVERWVCERCAALVHVDRRMLVDRHASMGRRSDLCALSDAGPH